MHAGDVVGLSGERIEAFYAQNWAFVRFLWDADNGKYRQAFQQMLIDTANGVSWKGDASADTPPPRRTILPTWDRSLVKPMLEHYFGADLTTLDNAYRAYVHQIAFDRFNEQWKAGM